MEQDQNDRDARAAAKAIEDGHQSEAGEILLPLQNAAKDRQLERRDGEHQGGPQRPGVGELELLAPGLRVQEKHAAEDETEDEDAN